MESIGLVGKRKKRFSLVHYLLSRGILVLSPLV